MKKSSHKRIYTRPFCTHMSTDGKFQPFPINTRDFSPAMCEKRAGLGIPGVYAPPKEGKQQ